LFELVNLGLHVSKQTGCGLNLRLLLFYLRFLCLDQLFLLVQRTLQICQCCIGARA